MQKKKLLIQSKSQYFHTWFLKQSGPTVRNILCSLHSITHNNEHKTSTPDVGLKTYWVMPAGCKYSHDRSGQGHLC